MDPARPHDRARRRDVAGRHEQRDLGRRKRNGDAEQNDEGGGGPPTA
jgi:hypothetical protein